MRLILVIGLATASLLGCSGKTATEVLRKANELIVKEESKIWRAAHPTVAKYKLRYYGHSKTPTGYQVKYAFVAERGFTTVLGFNFNPQGALSGVDPDAVIEVLEDGASIRAFLGADTAVGVLRQDIKDRIDQLPTDVRGEFKDWLDRKLSAKGLAGLWLKLREWMSDNAKA